MPILYGGIISIGITYTLQIVAQRNAKPCHAAIILSLESVFKFVDTEGIALTTGYSGMHIDVIGHDDIANSPEWI